MNQWQPEQPEQDEREQDEEDFVREAVEAPAFPFEMIDGAEKAFFIFALLQDGHRGRTSPERTRSSHVFPQAPHS